MDVYSPYICFYDLLCALLSGRSNECSPNLLPSNARMNQISSYGYGEEYCSCMCFFFWKLAACINDVSWCIYRNQTFAESIYSNMSILASSLIDTNMKVILVYSKLKQSCLSFTSVSNQDRFQLEIRSQCPLTGTLWSNNTIFHAVSSLCEGWWEMRLPRSCADCHWRSFFGHNLPFQKPHFD